MKLTVYTGVNCPKCPPAKELCKEVAAEMNIDFVEMNIQENMIEALQNQIASTPSIMINDEVIFRSEPPTKDLLLEEIRKRI